MSFSPDNHHDELGELGRKAQLIRSQLREGGPDVNIEHLYHYIADTLSASVRKEVRERIYTWRDWFNAYWQLGAELNFCEAALDDAALSGGLESSTDFLGQAQDESSEPSEYLADEAARYLQLEYEELLDEFSVFAGSVRQRRPTWSLSGKTARNCLCRLELVATKK